MPPSLLARLRNRLRPAAKAGATIFEDTLASPPPPPYEELIASAAAPNKSTETQPQQAYVLTASELRKLHEMINFVVAREMTSLRDWKETTGLKTDFLNDLTTLIRDGCTIAATTIARGPSCYNISSTEAQKHSYLQEFQQAQDRITCVIREASLAFKLTKGGRAWLGSRHDANFSPVLYAEFEKRMRLYAAASAAHAISAVAYNAALHRHSGLCRLAADIACVSNEAVKEIASAYHEN